MNFNIGDKAQFSKTISESDIYTYAGITGDLNPMHVNEEFAKNTRYGKRIAHGLLTSSFICTVLGMKLPGPGTIHISQELKFLKPVFIGDTITASLQIVEVLEKGYLKIQTTILNQNNVIVVDGYAVVKPPKS
jgi:3-hydroxybutyryl-CoA dehydratase